MSGTQILDHLLSITVLLERDMRTDLESRGLTVARTHLLWVLGETGPTTQQALSELLKVTPRNVTALVDALVHSGFVTREAHPTDRRATHVTLTTLGTTTVETLRREREQLGEQLVSALDERDVGAVLRGLATLSNRLTELVIEAEASQ